MVVARGCEEKAAGVVEGHRVSGFQDEGASAENGRGSCKTVWRTSMPLDCALTNDQGGTFITCVFYSNYKQVVLAVCVCVCVCVSVSVSESCPTLRPQGLWLARLFCPWNFPGKNTGVDCHSLLHGIFPTQGLNQGLLHCGRIRYFLSHQRSPAKQLDKKINTQPSPTGLLDAPAGQEAPRASALRLRKQELACPSFSDSPTH